MDKGAGAGADPEELAHQLRTTRQFLVLKCLDSSHGICRTMLRNNAFPQLECSFEDNISIHTWLDSKAAVCNCRPKSRTERGGLTKGWHAALKCWWGRRDSQAITFHANERTEASVSFVIT